MPPQPPAADKEPPIGSASEELFHVLDSLVLPEDVTEGVRAAIIAAHAQGYRDGYETALGPRLSHTEAETLQLMSQGLRSVDIAAARNVGVETTKSQKSRIFEKLGARNSTHAVRIGIERGLISIEINEEPDPRSLPSVDLAVLDQLSLGLNTWEIAEKLGRTQHTVTEHRRSILKKLGCRGSGAMNLAVRLAFENGILPLASAGQEEAPGLEVATTDPSGSEIIVSEGHGPDNIVGKTALRGTTPTDA